MGSPQPQHDPAVRFSPRQASILALSALGFTDKQIAAELQITRRTVRTQIERVYARYGIHTRAAAITLMMEGRAPASAPAAGHEAGEIL